MPNARIIICSFESTSDIKGLHGKYELHGAAAERVYASLKATVLKAGRFSIFEATGSKRGAVFFERLHNDPELEVEQQPYPWLGVKLKDGRTYEQWLADHEEHAK